MTQKKPQKKIFVYYMSSITDEELKELNTKIADLEGVNSDFYDEYNKAKKDKTEDYFARNYTQKRAEIIRTHARSMPIQEYNNLKTSLDSIEKTINEKNTLLANEGKKKINFGFKEGKLKKELTELQTIQTKLKVLLELYAEPLDEAQIAELIDKMNERTTWPENYTSENKIQFEQDKKETTHGWENGHETIQFPKNTIAHRLEMRKKDFLDEAQNNEFYKYLKNIEANVNNTELSYEVESNFKLLKEVYAPKYYYVSRYGGKRKTRKNKKTKKSKSRKSSRK